MANIGYRPQALVEVWQDSASRHIQVFTPSALSWPSCDLLAREADVSAAGISTCSVRSLLPSGIDPCQKTGSPVVVSIENLLTGLQRKHIMIPNLGEVRGYLLNHSDMIDFLECACGVSAERFGNDTQLSLELYHDPEIFDEYPTLYARRQHYEAQLLDTIESISAEFSDGLEGKSGRFLLTTDFQPPR